PVVSKALVQPWGSVPGQVPTSSCWFDIAVEAEEIHGIKLLLKCGQSGEIRAVVAVRSLILGVGVVQVDVVTVRERSQLAPGGANCFSARFILRWILPKSEEHHVRDGTPM